MTLYAAPIGASDPEILQGRVCAYCHTPHHAITTGNDYLPLWSHTLPNKTYTPYNTATIDATIDPQTMMEGPSLLCMSCHDGAIAVDTHYAFTGGKYLTQSDTDFATPVIGKDGILSNDHPIGFVYDGINNADGVATGPVTGDPPLEAHVKGKDEWVRISDATFTGSTMKIADRLYASQTRGGRLIMTCATCHDVHNKKNQDEANATNYLLLGSNRNSALCLSCHIK
ncbi:hypothetical protein LPW11_20225 [Geomonas sp. RF6]|uniref:hypothetical protein n=1 Tax=Geomonas sp. RF6 TaxID=2897342 RepID=UPI001E42C942|nr:hypothetical protein [Geomonas sp. RF6]UFS70188.1 hypothetical protein LPW11_20225 [Geomonas sp. RF6]